MRSEPHTNHGNGKTDIYIYASTRPIEINVCVRPRILTHVHNVQSLATTLATHNHHCQDEAHSCPILQPLDDHLKISCRSYSCNNFDHAHIYFLFKTQKVSQACKLATYCTPLNILRKKTKHVLC